MKYSKFFAENLRELRNRKGITQKELAELLGYSEKTVSKWECGACVPDIEVLFELAKIFTVTIEEMFCEKDFYLLGIDGGGTKTALALADTEGNIIRTCRTLPCNPMDIGLKAAEKILKDGIYEICEGIPFSSVYCFAGISGGTSAGMQEALKEFFSQFGFRKFQNDTDNKNVIASGLGDRDGIAVIIGTGVCVYTQINRQHSRIAGWGYLIDNGGSGYNLGRDALNAYFCAYDKSAPETALTDEIDKLYPGGVPKIMGYIYGEGKKAVASFAPAVFTAAEKGDKTAKNILKRNIDEIAHLIETAGKEFEKGKIPVVLAGGLTNRECILEGIREALGKDSRFDVVIADKAPVSGALLIAEKLMKGDGKDA